MTLIDVVPIDFAFYTVKQTVSIRFDITDHDRYISLIYFCHNLAT